MHDCRKTQMQMTDWLFEETSTSHMSDIGDCQLCYEQYHELRNALNSFDLVSEAMMPAENYWSGYEADLRVKLAREVAPKRWSGVNWRLGWMIPAAVGLAILLFIVMGNSRTPQSTNAPGNETAADKIAVPSPGPRSVEFVNDTPREPKKPRTDKQSKPERKSPSRIPEKKPYLLNDPNPILASFEAPATKHFERAQMLLREFRNAPANNQATFDLASEKKRARKLLYETIVMRRDAEARGDLPTEEVLSDLEPLLLDIANLPKHPTTDDVTPIKERMQKKEIVAKLQFYATPMTVAALDQ